MKKLLVTACGAAMISLATLAQAQQSAPRDYNDQNTLEQQAQDRDQRSKDQSQSTQNQPVQNESAQDQGVQDGTNAIQQGQSRESGQPSEDQIDQTKERPSEIVPIEGKEGPNGEVIFRENGKYYYMNEAGKKKKIKESDLRDKTQ